jgi:glycosyltransferase involved in cell wall biosynthesis
MDFWEMDNRELMGVNAKKRTEEFTWRNIALKTAEFYRGLIASK